MLIFILLHEVQKSCKTCMPSAYLRVHELPSGLLHDCTSLVTFTTKVFNRITIHWDTEHQRTSKDSTLHS